MTIERQKYLLPFIQAQCEGKTVWFRDKTDPDKKWEVHPDSSVCLGDKDQLEYLIKPKPREFTLYFDENNMLVSLFENAQVIYRGNQPEDVPARYIKVREVIE